MDPAAAGRWAAGEHERTQARARRRCPAGGRGVQRDRAQVHVAGASSGAGTAVILAATYPDVFATASSVAGGEYGLNQVDPDDPDSTPPDYTARQAWSQMGERARQVPLLVIQGEDDDVVPPLVATRPVEHWTAVSDLADDGLLNDSLDLVEETTTVPAEIVWDFVQRHPNESP